jgi:catechol 2,3-dioxygenase-like lactoylglutathione lyase family enzyme
MTSYPRLTAITLGVRDFAASVRFYEMLGFVRKMRSTGDEVAFFDAGGVMLALYRWADLAADAKLAAEPAPAAFRGMTLAWNRESPDEVDQGLTRALKAGGTLLKPAEKTSYGGYSGYFADPDGHVWEVVQAPGFGFTADGRLTLPD